MDALKSLLGLNRSHANRQNSRHSTGPTTEAGKARSRRNATRHGLAGAGVALPTEDEAAVTAHFNALHDQFQPTTPLAKHYVQRIALGIVRTERAARQESAALADRVRHAAAEFDHSRTVAANEALGRLRAGDPNARHDLIRSSEGIERLIDELRGLRLCLAYEKPVWSREHAARLDACLGVMSDPLVASRVTAWTEVLYKSEAFLTGRDRTAINEAATTPVQWALRQLAVAIDEEITALHTDHAAIDPAVRAADRAGAADRNLFDSTPAALLARRYEAAASREVDRAVRLLHEADTWAWQLDATGPDPAAEVGPAAATTGIEPDGAGLVRPDQLVATADVAEIAAAEPIDTCLGIGVKLTSDQHLTPTVGSFGAENRRHTVGAEGANNPRADGDEMLEGASDSNVELAGGVLVSESTTGVRWGNLVGSVAGPGSAAEAPLFVPS